MEKVDDLHQTLLGLVLPGHVLKGHAGGFFDIDLGVCLAHAAQAAAHLAGHIAEQEGEEHHHQHHGQHVADEQADDGGEGLLIGGAVLDHAVLLQQGDQAVIPHVGRGGRRAVIGLLGGVQGLQRGQAQLALGAGALRRGGALFGRFGLGVDGVLGAGHLHRFHFAVHHHLAEFAVGDLLRMGRTGHGSGVVYQYGDDQGPQDDGNDGGGVALAAGPPASAAAVTIIGHEMYILLGTNRSQLFSVWNENAVRLL